MFRYYLAIRFLLSRPINMLGVLGVMLGVWALIVVVSVFSGYLEEIGRHLRSSTAEVRIFGVREDARYDDLRAVVEGVDNVDSTAPRLVWYGLLLPVGKGYRQHSAPEPTTLVPETDFVSVIGLDPQAERTVTNFHSWLQSEEIEGELRVADPDAPLAAIDDSPALVLSSGRLRREGLQPGDAVRLTTGKFRRTGREDDLEFLDRDLRVAGGFATDYSAFDSLSVFAHIDALRELLVPDNPQAINEVAVRLHDPEQASATAMRIRDAVADAGFRDLRVATWEEANISFLSNVEHQRSILKLVLFVIMVVAGFLMYATLSMMVTEKVHDIGILTAMGATTRGVSFVFLACGLAIALAGILLGTVLGCVSAIYLDDLNVWLKGSFDIDLFPTHIYNLKHVPWSLDGTWILQVGIYALLIGVLVSGLPAWRAARHDPMTSLRQV